jgi:outer membrane protein with beta-barrel domain
MRRMISAWIAAIAVVGLAGTAFAAQKWTGSIDAGASLPSGDYGSTTKADANAGWAIGGSADYYWRSDVALGLDGSYGQNKNGVEGTVYDLGGGDTQTIDKASYTTWSFGGHAKYFFPTAATMPVKWYGLLGAGIYGFNPDIEMTTVTGGVSTSVA